MHREIYIQAKLNQVEQRRQQEALRQLAQLPRGRSLLRRVARMIGHALVWSGARLMAYDAERPATARADLIM